MVHCPDDATGGIQQDVEINHFQSDLFIDHAEQDKDVGNQDGREQFEEVRIRKAKEMAADKRLQANALSLLIEAVPHQWIQQTTWFGEPVLQLPQDLLSLQEIIFRTRPDYVIEVGVAWAGLTAAGRLAYRWQPHAIRQ